ncbi:MAG: hypothetical protein ABI557_17980, partial [Aureliella sp.]
MLSALRVVISDKWIESLFYLNVDMPDAVHNDLERLVEGGAAELAILFEELRPRLERLVEFRLHPGLRGRVDTADVLQEAYLTISARLP